MFVWWRGKISLAHSDRPLSSLSVMLVLPLLLLLLLIHFFCSSSDALSICAWSTPIMCVMIPGFLLGTFGWQDWACLDESWRHAPFWKGSESEARNVRSHNGKEWKKGGLKVLTLATARPLLLLPEPLKCNARSTGLIFDRSGDGLACCPHLVCSYARISRTLFYFCYCLQMVIKLSFQWKD